MAAAGPPPGAARGASPTVAGRARRGGYWAFIAPAAMVSVGYMDPGNWATDLEGGARFGYGLLWVLLVSNVVALVLQTLAARLGIVSGLDLAGACRAHYSKATSVALWLAAELAIVACDLAEILGSAVAINLLFGAPLLWGALLTVLDVFVILALQRRGARTLEAIVLALLVAIALCLAGELWLTRPSGRALASGLVPRLTGERLYLAIGILGATVMPHNLYLHSALVRTGGPTAPAERRRALRGSFVSTVVALNTALFVNAAILALAAAAFGSRGLVVTDLREAHRLLAPVVGTGVASVLFAVGLLCSGQSATITGTLAGQIVMEGFVRLRVPPVVRRAITRGLAVVPAVVVLAAFGDAGTMPLLVASQVVLSLQLPFAVVPLIRLTNFRPLMGSFVNRPAVRLAAGGCALLVTAANGWLIARSVAGWSDTAPLGAALVALLALAALASLGWLCIVPLRRGEAPART